MATTYGIISDAHNIEIGAVLAAVNILVEEGIDALVLNGDLSGEGSGQDSANYFANVLSICARSGLETYVSPGSHEEVRQFESILRAFSAENNNIINVIENPFIDQGDHHLVFVYGSDSAPARVAGKGYKLQEEGASNLYPGKEGGIVRTYNMNDLRKIVTDPDITVVFSHIPRRFSGANGSVDVDVFYELAQQCEIEGKMIPAGSVWPSSYGPALEKKNIPVFCKRENRGNEGLQRLFEDLGIRKAASGHYHESAGMAHDSAGNPVEDSTYVKELFYNASCLDQLKIGMLSVEGNEVAYENITMQKNS